MKNTKQKMPNAHLHDLFVDELRTILGGEKLLLKGLKTMAEKATNSSLQHAFSTHLKETENHIARLHSVFESLDISPRAKKCRAMIGLLNEATEIMDEYEHDLALNAAMIAAAQKIEHYEIATYGCLVTYAKLMKHLEAKRLLEITLEEEKAANTFLTEIANTEANLS